MRRSPINPRRRWNPRNTRRRRRRNRKGDEDKGAASLPSACPERGRRPWRGSWRRISPAGGGRGRGRRPGRRTGRTCMNAGRGATAIIFFFFFFPWVKVKWGGWMHASTHRTVPRTARVPECGARTLQENDRESSSMEAPCKKKRRDPRHWKIHARPAGKGSAGDEPSHGKIHHHH